MSDVFSTKTNDASRHGLDPDSLLSYLIFYSRGYFVYLVENSTLNTVFPFLSFFQIALIVAVS